MGFRSLRVLNDDRVKPGRGFGTHPHKDVEIVSYVVEGALAHRDSMGTGSVIRAGDVQRMTAGTGVTHSEYNHSDAEDVRFLQIWIQPETRGLTPDYEQKSFTREHKADQLRLIVSRDGRDGSIKIHQDVLVFASVLSVGTKLNHDIADDRQVWIQVIQGDIVVNGVTLYEGDGLSSSQESRLSIELDESSGSAEFLLFDLA